MIVDAKIFQSNRSVEAAVLFGSQARGDSDSSSDVDVAVFANVEDFDALGKIKTQLASDIRDADVTVSLYSTRTAEILAQDGSLFLWHLNLEGKVLFERGPWISYLYARLKPYGQSKALRDLNTFERILNDVQDALRRAEGTELYEAATMYAILRNAGMIFTHLKGAPCFGRFESISRLAIGMGEQFPFSRVEIRRLETLRLAYTRLPSLSFVSPDPDWCLAVNSGLVTVLGFVRESIYATQS